MLFFMVFGMTILNFGPELMELLVFLPGSQGIMVQSTRICNGTMYPLHATTEATVFECIFSNFMVWLAVAKGL